MNTNLHQLMGDYQLAQLGLVIMLLTVVVQSLVAAVSKARLPGAIPGKIDNELGHDSFVFRAHRTFMNSLENVPFMLSAGLLAMFVGANPEWCGWSLMIYAVARVIYTVLYYMIGTEKNPSPRSYFFLIGLAANIVLLVVITGAVLSNG